MLSAIANWQAKNEEASLEDADLFIKGNPCRWRNDVEETYVQLHKDAHTELENVPIM